MPLLLFLSAAEKKCKVCLHDQQAGKQQQAAEIGLGRQHLVGDKEGQNGVKHRLQTEDDPHVGGSGILEGDSLDEKSRSGTEKGED